MAFDPDLGRDYGARNAEGEPKLAFACIDGTLARAHQKAAGSATEQTDNLSLRFNPRLAAIRRLWNPQGAALAARSLAFAMRQAGSSFAETFAKGSGLGTGLHGVRRKAFRLAARGIGAIPAVPSRKARGSQN